ncbi:HlyD family efflux transporter periplasmic adaptor subunit [Alteromonas sp. ASW11-36]|uniref:HlyD family efflux transporter periplasmic adaptor subunit n=1 Tax=Alteromonas arenosi TaxID=3055817 RepID=A0ABT7SYQ8_9ALTE|nr:HlyD family efflux transporter periplasmic adaptor subunit [Alteromonas sp. ASW11-36]MDM7861328.1 HlyD family efflux transporter periplasmic adaptor subunit [Alteromonas sp. ASW11-36]
MTKSKDKITLFRRQSLQFQQQRLQGSVLIRVSPPLVLCWSLLLLWIALVAVWLITQEYTRKVTVQGWLMPVTGIAKQFTGQRRGMIESLHVTEGQFVVAGQAIATIRPFSETGYDQAMLTTLATEIDIQLATIEQRITATHALDQAHMATLERQRQHHHQAQYSIVQQQHNLDNQLTLLNNRLERYSTAHRSGHIAENDIESLTEQKLQLTFRRQSMAREYSQYANNIEAINNKIAESPLHTQIQITLLLQQLSELRQQRAELSGLQQFEVVATSDGVVANLLVREGQSIEPMQSILSLLPANAKLEAHLLVPVGAAGQLKIGSNIRLKYDAYPFEKYGLHLAELKSLSATSINPTDLLDNPLPVNASVYLAFAELTTAKMQLNDEPIALHAGMTLSADIELESRTLWEWLIGPIRSLQGEWQ